MRLTPLPSILALQGILALLLARFAAEGARQGAGGMPALQAARVSLVVAQTRASFNGTAERLLLAGLDYSEERHVLYVAERPPRTWFHGVAERLGKQLIYLPLGQLNPGTVRKIRFFHVLDGHHVREYAEQYIR